MTGNIQHGHIEGGDMPALSLCPKLGDDDVFLGFKVQRGELLLQK